jgi:hypothetical protein
MTHSDDLVQRKHMPLLMKSILYWLMTQDSWLYLVQYHRRSSWIQWVETKIENLVALQRQLANGFIWKKNYLKKEN